MPRSMSVVSVVVYFLVCILTAGVLCDGEPMVQIPNGILKGTLETSYNGRTFSQFEGIPYAKPPIGELRFKAPEEIGSWTGIWHANTKHICIQSFTGVKEHTVSGDEDCLYLNVYVPRAKPTPSDNMDVIVHIHGGAFMLGSAHFYSGPKYLMDEDVILVTINYRLGPFGFLSTEDETVPGNNGLKDQNLALKWIKKNIQFFGGNPDSVTLTGMSAGGASVHFHYLSPLSKGYFHKGVSQSGNALNPWAMQEAPLEKSKKLAALLGCESESTKRMAECLRQRSARKIMESVWEFFVYENFPFSPFGPVVEVKTENAFLTDHPRNLLQSGKINDVPWLTSITKDEGIYPGGYFYRDLNKLEKNWEEILPHLLDYNYTTTAIKKPEIAKKLKDFYFEGKPVTENYFALTKMCGDRHFAIGSEESVRLQGQISKSPIFYYILAYRGENSFSQYFQETDDDTGVSHADDVLYYFNTAISPETLSKSDELMKQVFLKMITSFASTGVPKIENVDWLPVTSGKELSYLYVANPRDIKMAKAVEMAPMEFWRSLGLVEHHDVYVKDEL